MTPSMRAAADGTFASAKPRAVDFAQGEYECAQASFDEIAASHGYRLAGFRLKRAVFTTKAAPSAPEARYLAEGA